MVKRVSIAVEGIVQGVGFRPFVYTIAKKLDLKGFVLNNGGGVQIEVEGEPKNITLFWEHLQNRLPPLARIDHMTTQDTPLQGEVTFSICQSTQSTKHTPVSPDMALCKQCLNELRNPNDRRYGYFATNCTHCGPRYSIIETIPYDRVFTSMKYFPLCPSCSQEYKNPLDRRYHAQPISCYECGPTLTLHNTKHQKIDSNNLIQKVATLFKDGAIIAVKGLGGFHLMCDGYNHKSVALLRRRKNRPLKPLALLFPTIEMIKQNATLTPYEEEMIVSKEKPIVLVDKKRETQIASNVAPDIDRIGVMLPYTPLQVLIFDYFKNPLVATSANLSHEPIIRTKDALLQELGSVVDYILDFNREIVNAVDDTVVQMINHRPLFLRLARGFTPKSIPLPFKLNKKVLAVGAAQKNTMAFAFDTQVILSPHIGDLNSIEAFEYFERTLHTFQQFYNFTPELIVCDRHPDYATSIWAKQQQIPVLEVQHHHAHILSVMMEQQLQGQVLGIAFDGTGYGDDGTLWGGEFLLSDGDYAFERVASFKPIVLLGGDKAIQEPRRIALAMAFEIMDLESVKKTKISDQFTATELTLLHQAYQNSINTTQTSSLGRIFDGVASVLQIVHVLSFEGESGLKMEQYYDKQLSDYYHFTFHKGVINYDPMIFGLLQESNLTRGVSMFFNTIIEIIISIAHAHNVPLVLSGGVFQNKVLVTLLFKRLEKEKIKYYFPQNIPPNDGAIALGQIAYAIRYGR